MKYFITLLLLLVGLNLSAQHQNLSGEWVGTITTNNKTSKFALTIKIKDECNLIYDVTQLDYSDNNFVTYAMIQSKNSLIRDVSEGWSSKDSNPAVELKLNYTAENTLDGFRLQAYDEKIGTYKENIKLTRKGKPSFLNTCAGEIKYSAKPKYITKIKKEIEYVCVPDTIRVPIYYEKKDTTTTCASIAKTNLPNNVFNRINSNSILYIKVKDNAASDNDKITLFLNDSKLMINQSIYSILPYSFPITIDNPSMLSWCSCNSGTVGVNTGEIIIEEYLENKPIQTKNYQVSLQSNQQYLILLY